MASLTGNKIKDTYTSLLKVGDNGTIDSSAQALTDGAGNALGLTLTNTGVLVSTAKGTLVGTSSTGEVSSAMIADNAITATQLNISGDGTAGQLIQSDGDGSFSYTSAAGGGDITSVVAGTGLSGGGTTGDVTLSLASSTSNSFTAGGNGSTGGVTLADGDVQVRTGTGNVAKIKLYCESSNAHFQTIQAAPHSSASSAVLTLPTATGTIVATGDTGSVATAMVADNGITHDKIENRYTAKVDITTYTGAVSIDWSAGTTFVMGSSLSGAIEFDFTNYKQGQVITFHNLTGSQTITLDSDAGTSETFNKVGGVDYDGSTTNMLQVECIDDSANAIFNYYVATYASDTTPS